MAQERVYLPQMCSMKTEAMNTRLMTSTGTGPLAERRCQAAGGTENSTHTLMPGESSV